MRWFHRFRRLLSSFLEESSECVEGERTRKLIGDLVFQVAVLVEDQGGAS